MWLRERERKRALGTKTAVATYLQWRLIKAGKRDSRKIQKLSDGGVSKSFSPFGNLPSGKNGIRLELERARARACWPVPNFYQALTR